MKSDVTQFLHPALARRIEDQEQLGTLDVAALKQGDQVKVQTRNTLYEMTLVAPSQDGRCPEFLLKGGRFAEPTTVYLTGSTFGGSVIQQGHLGVSMHMEIYVPSTGHTLTTSAIQSLEVER